MASNISTTLHLSTTIDSNKANDNGAVIIIVVAALFILLFGTYISCLIYTHCKKKRKFTATKKNINNSAPSNNTTNVSNTNKNKQFQINVSSDNQTDNKPDIKEENIKNKP
eukprot:547477_1